VPRTDVLLYGDRTGRSPIVDWLENLKKKDKRGFAKCAALIRRLGLEGRELRRPVADYVRDGIFELRARSGHVNHRLLYFFTARDTVVLVHALSKEARIPPPDLRRALDRKRAFESDPEAHTYEGTVQ
jgi:hypothetical protein